MRRRASRALPRRQRPRPRRRPTCWTVCYGRPPRPNPDPDRDPNRDPALTLTPTVTSTVTLTMTPTVTLGMGDLIMTDAPSAVSAPAPDLIATDALVGMSNGGNVVAAARAALPLLTALVQQPMNPVNPKVCGWGVYSYDFLLLPSTSYYS